MPGRPWTYLPAEPSANAVNVPFYKRIAAETARRTLAYNHVVPIRSGYAWAMQAGQVCRVVAVEGPQVVDFNAWNLHNPRERFWAARTRQLESTHLTNYHRLWSVLPYLRPMLTITKETVQYGEDEDGGRCHDLLGTRCDPYVTKLLMGESFDFNCHSNLDPRHSSLASQRVRRARRAQHLPGHRPERGWPLLHEGQPGPTGRLLRVHGRDRPPLRRFDLPGRRPLDSPLGPGRRRSPPHLPADRHQGLRPAAGAPSRDGRHRGPPTTTASSASVSRSGARKVELSQSPGVGCALG